MGHAAVAARHAAAALPFLESRSALVLRLEVLAGRMRDVTFALVAILALSVPAAARQDPSPADIKAAMEKAKRFTQPGPSHKVLERFIGTWTTETRVFMGDKPSPAEKGTAQFAWLMPGRWVRSEMKGSMMGLPIDAFMLFGYDNFKQSFVVTSITSMDTAMNRAEGDMDPGGAALIAYGTIDEYLTGEHDKMVKYVWRFVSPTRIVMEVHDLPIGERNTKVVETVFIKGA
jgi:hypothetical protein